MARKDRNLAGFDDVAKNNVNDDYNDNINVNINDKKSDKINNNGNNNINDDDNDTDFLDKLIQENKKKENNQVLRGIYFDKEIALIIDKLAKKGSRGMKSKIVNEALRKVFTEKGLL